MNLIGQGRIPALPASFPNLAGIHGADAISSCATEVMTPMLARAGVLVALVAAALAIVTCTHADGQPSGGPSSYGTLTGRVTRGPMSPLSGPGIPVPPAPPVAGAELKIVDSKGVVAATARTDGDGLYHVALPPGQYRIERGEGFRGATKNLPATVAISVGQQTRLEIVIDTGIR